MSSPRAPLRKPRSPPHAGSAGASAPAAAQRGHHGGKTADVLSWLVLAAFILLYSAGAAMGKLAAWPAYLLYAPISTLAMLFYAIDKFAARRGLRRVPESALLMLGIYGGWPGAIVAQQLLRHKTCKLSFRIWFWLTVAMNIAAAAWLATL